MIVPLELVISVHTRVRVKYRTSCDSQCIAYNSIPPLRRVPYISKHPPVHVIGAAPKNPLKKRVIRMVWISFEVAVLNENTMAIKQGIKTVHFLLYTSDNRAQTSGPNPNL